MADRFPWFPFYAADWRLSRAVREMTPEQRGAYIELLCIAWDDGIEEPSLPDDAVQLASMSGLSKRWKVAGGPVRDCFEARGDGRLYNDRLTKVWEIQRAKYVIRSEAGKLGGIAKAKRVANHLANGRHSQDSASGFAGQTQKSDRTKSSSGPQRLGALTDGAVAAVGRRQP